MEQVETTTAETTETVVTTETQPQPAAQSAAELQVQLDKVQKALKDANKEAADRRKKLEELEKAEQARKDAELSEQDRLKKENETLRIQAATAQRELLQRSVADEIGLPLLFASRIQGADKDAMLTDAKALLEAMPKAKLAAGSATNPGAASGGETDEQKRKRLGLR